MRKVMCFAKLLGEIIDCAAGAEFDPEDLHNPCCPHSC